MNDMTTSRQVAKPVNAEGIDPGAGFRPAAKTSGPLSRMLALDDFIEAARWYMPRPIYGYVTGGAETNAALRGNREQWDEVAFVVKTLVDTSARQQKTTLFGRTYDAPFGIAPMGGTAMAAYQGDLALARAAGAANIPMILSGAALTKLEDVKKEGPTA